MRYDSLIYFDEQAFERTHLIPDVYYDMTIRADDGQVA